jgi:hypothetical protein
VYLFGALPKMSWFKHDPDLLAVYSIAVLKNAMEGAEFDTPKGWSKPARQQLPPRVLELRTTINWAIPKADLESAFSKEEATLLRSLVMYAAGAGFCLLLELAPNEDEKCMLFSIYIEKVACKLPGTEHRVSCIGAQLRQCEIRMEVMAPPGPRYQVVSHDECTTFQSSLGGDLCKLSSISDLDQHLVDGCLKLEATFTVMH